MADRDLFFDPSRTLHARLAALGLAVVGAWLLAAALWLGIEPHDGLDNIVNARFVLGSSEVFIPHRFPALALWLAPAEWLARWLAIAPLDLRPHHLIIAAGHLGYLIAVWRMVAAGPARPLVALTASALALLTASFFTHARHVSADLVPGALLLGMLLAGHRYARGGRTADAGLVVALGAAAALFKIAHAIFWPVLLLALVVGRPADVATATWHRRLARLGVGALASAAIYWSACATVLSGAFPETPWLWRPWQQILFIYDTNRLVAPTPWWLYGVNAWTQGLTAAVLLGPGLVLSWRARGRSRALAAAWLLVFASLQCLPHRELRYLAVLAPLTACLLVPVLERVAARRRLLAPLALCVALDLGLALHAAGDLGSPFARGQTLQTLLAPLGDLDVEAALVPARPLFLVDPRPSLVVADPYHGLLAIGPLHLKALFGGHGNRVQIYETLPPPWAWPDLAANPRRGRRLIFMTTGPLLRPPRLAVLTARELDPTDSHRVLRAEWHEQALWSARGEPQACAPSSLQPAEPASTGGGWVLECAAVTASLGAWIAPHLHLGRDWYALVRREGPRSLWRRATGHGPDPTAPERTTATLVGYLPRAVCSVEGCHEL